MTNSATIAIKTGPTTYAHVLVGANAEPDQMFEALWGLSDLEVLQGYEYLGVDEYGELMPSLRPEPPTYLPQPTLTEDFLYMRDDDGLWWCANRRKN